MNNSHYKHKNNILIGTRDLSDAKPMAGPADCAAMKRQYDNLNPGKLPAIFYKGEAIAARDYLP